MKSYKKALFIFRRDLRLEDNTSLIAALNNSEKVIPCFIFDERQLEKNPYRGDNLVQFMLESLDDLDKDLRKKKKQLYFFYGKTEDIVEKLVNKEKIDVIFVNRDYTPFSKKRDDKIKKICTKNEMDFFAYGDYLLNEPELIKNQSGEPYKVYSAFLRYCKKIRVKKPVRNVNSNYFSGKIGGSENKDKIFKKILKEKNKDIFSNGGRKEAKKRLSKLKDLINYKKERDFPALSATTGLSAHNKFGTISIREFYWSVHEDLDSAHTLIDELYWRDFFTHIVYHFPHVFGESFNKKYDKLDWENDKKKFTAWCEGKTGFPIVDAGMRELNTTGYMHNRVRMIVASFLTKDLHIDWRWGEKYFAQKLVDYDPSVNNGNWQWAASTGCDAQPYFRIFNPWSQQKKFDFDCEYIKRWVPELKELSSKEIHNLDKESFKGYPEPIVEHSVESKKALAMYKKIK